MKQIQATFGQDIQTTFLYTCIYMYANYLVANRLISSCHTCSSDQGMCEVYRWNSDFSRRLKIDPGCSIDRSLPSDDGGITL